MSFLENLNWRYATKKFDNTKKVSEADVQKIREAIHLAPTSLGVEMFEILEVDNKDIREKLKEASYGQTQIVDADKLFVFVARNDAEARVEKMFSIMSGGNEEVRKEQLDGYEGMVRGFIAGLDKDKIFAWSEKNIGIALGFGLAACAELKVDSCPMDGFDQKAVKEVLGLGDEFLPVAFLAVGYRAEDDSAAARPKWRFPIEETIKKI